MSLHVRSFRSVFAAVSLIALAGLFQISPSMAATAVDPGIYSGAPFVFKADRGIFSAVPTQQVDKRIFSPTNSTTGTHVPTFVQDDVRLRHDI